MQVWFNIGKFINIIHQAYLSLGQEDPLEKGICTHSSILAWKIPWTEKEAWMATVHLTPKSDMTEQLTRQASL